MIDGDQADWFGVGLVEASSRCGKSIALNIVSAMQFGYAEAKSLRAKIELAITFVIVAQSGGREHGARCDGSSPQQQRQHWRHEFGMER